MTEANLRDVFDSQSQAQVLYQEYAQRAREEGFENVARIFDASAFSQRVRAAHVAHVLEDVHTTAQNLAIAVKAEVFDVQQMYPAYVEVAKLQGEDRAEESLHAAIQAERNEVNLYQEAQSAIDSGRDVEVLAVFVCPDCGFTAKDQPPEQCPVSGTPGFKFHGF
jgi:rubrerythrin